MRARQIRWRPRARVAATSATSGEWRRPATSGEEWAVTSATSGGGAHHLLLPPASDRKHGRSEVADLVRLDPEWERPVGAEAWQRARQAAGVGRVAARRTSRRLGEAVAGAADELGRRLGFLFLNSFWNFIFFLRFFLFALAACKDGDLCKRFCACS